MDRQETIGGCCCWFQTPKPQKSDSNLSLISRVCVWVLSGPLDRSCDLPTSFKVVQSPTARFSQHQFSPFLCVSMCSLFVSCLSLFGANLTCMSVNFWVLCLFSLVFMFFVCICVHFILVCLYICSLPISVCAHFLCIYFVICSRSLSVCS